MDRAFKAKRIPYFRSLTMRKGRRADMPCGPSHMCRELVSDGLDIQVGDVQRIFLNEVAAWLHHIAHELGEDFIRQIGLCNFHAQERAIIRI